MAAGPALGGGGDEVLCRACGHRCLVPCGDPLQQEPFRHFLRVASGNLHQFVDDVPHGPVFFAEFFARSCFYLLPFLSGIVGEFYRCT